MYDDKTKKALTDKVGEFLFRRPKANGDAKDETESQFLDTSTVISGKADYAVIAYYRVLKEAYGCEVAGKIADILERLNIATVRSSEAWNARMEGVTVLRQPLPKKETLLRGIAETLKEEETE